MVKLYRTYDVFDTKNEKARNEWLTVCIFDALKCGLSCERVVDGTKTKLYMTGTKKQFVTYYLNTMFYNKHVMAGVRRLMQCISWR
mgnify:CR=1 FL=1